MYLVEINFKFPDLKKRFLKHTNDIYQMIAATMQTQRAMIFDSEGQYNGRSGWEPLKIRQGQILKDRGTLSKSIGPETSGNGTRPGRAEGSIVRFSGDTVTIGTNVKYAAIHNYGGVIYPKNKKMLRFPNGQGGFIFAKKVTIPARQFNDITQMDRQEIEASVVNYIAEILNGTD